jgi:hypothetical protein
MKNLNKIVAFIIWSLFSLVSNKEANSQQMDTLQNSSPKKNIVRYNFSSALIFGLSHCIVLGYERLIRPKQSFSVNFGKISLPDIINVNTDSLQLTKESKSNGVNASVDYRFYLARENKYQPPHGLYIGPYYSYNHYTRDIQWNYLGTNGNTAINTYTKFTINTVGFEIGYQLILWKRLTLDMLMVGPGLGFYHYKANYDGNMDAAAREQLNDALKQILTQKFPGMNYVLADKELSANGTLTTTDMGYRYLIQIGYNF